MFCAFHVTMFRFSEFETELHVIFYKVDYILYENLSWKQISE